MQQATTWPLKNEIESSEAPWMDLENGILSEASQPRDMSDDIPYIRNLIQYTNTYVWNLGRWQ